MSVFVWKERRKRRGERKGRTKDWYYMLLKFLDQSVASIQLHSLLVLMHKDFLEHSQELSPSVSIIYPLQQHSSSRAGVFEESVCPAILKYLLSGLLWLFQWLIKLTVDLWLISQSLPHSLPHSFPPYKVWILSIKFHLGIKCLSPTLVTYLSCSRTSI